MGDSSYFLAFPKFCLHNRSGEQSKVSPVYESKTTVLPTFSQSKNKGHFPYHYQTVDGIKLFLQRAPKVNHVLSRVHSLELSPSKYYYNSPSHRKALTQEICCTNSVCMFCGKQSTFLGKLTDPSQWSVPSSLTEFMRS